MVKSIIPKSYSEALELLKQRDLTIISGGTDLMVKKRNWSGLLPKFSKDVLLTSNLKELNFIEKRDEYIHIGANVTLESLINSKFVPDLLKRAVSSMASPAIRNIATIGGNIGNASPAGDTLPILYLLEALIILESIDGKRQIPIRDFILGPGITVLKNNELIKEIVLKNKKFKYTLYEKVGGRKADAISKISFVGAVNIENEIIKDFRVAFGAVGPKIVILPLVENRIIGMERQKAKDVITWIVKNYELEIVPIDDQRSSAHYRKTCAINLLKYFIQNM